MKKLFSYILTILFGIGVFCLNPIAVYADEPTAPVYTNVLADLQKDENFNVINYPERDETFLRNPNNVHLQLIQIAESTGGELFAYVYQPCQKIMPLTATEVNMSLAETVDGTSLFPLTLLNTNGVFCKYLVQGVIVSDNAERFYNITSIYRDFIEGLDPPTGNDNIKNAVAYEVGQVFKVTTENGAAKYESKKIDTIKILNPYVDHLVYDDGLQWDFIFANHDTNVHYIAFDTDFPIDTLQEADISYYTQPYTWKNRNGGSFTYGDKSEIQYKILDGNMEGGNEGDGFLGIKYTWKRIQRSTDFIAKVELSETAKTEVEKTKWVLLFLETPFTETQIDLIGGAREITRKGTKVSEVTILRLKFVTAGKPYNLGTVSDKLTGDDIPGGGSKPLGWLDTLCKWLEQVTGVPAFVWKIIICALPFVILLPILSAVFPVVGQVLAAGFKAISMAIVWLFKGLWWLICLPFKSIARAVSAIKRKTQSKKHRSKA